MSEPIRSRYRSSYCDLVAALPGRRLRGAEIGVARGELSHYLLAHIKRLHRLYMIDQWCEIPAGHSYRRTRDSLASQTAEQWQDMETLSRTVASYFPKRAVIIKQPSSEAVQPFRDNWLDFVFIDADHSYEGCLTNLREWYPKVRNGGLFSGHDYRHTRFRGVSKAVDEFAAANGLTVTASRGHIWSVVK